MVPQKPYVEQHSWPGQTAPPARAPHWPLCREKRRFLTSPAGSWVRLRSNGCRRMSSVFSCASTPRLVASCASATTRAGFSCTLSRPASSSKLPPRGREVARMACQIESRLLRSVMAMSCWPDRLGSQAAPPSPLVSALSRSPPIDPSASAPAQHLLGWQHLSRRSAWQGLAHLRDRAEPIVPVPGMHIALHLWINCPTRVRGRIVWGNCREADWPVVLSRVYAGCGRRRAVGSTPELNN